MMETAASHQRAIKMLWLHYWAAVMSIFIQSLRFAPTHIFDTLIDFLPLGGSTTIVFTHRAVADVFLISGSDCSLYIGGMQETVRQHYVEGEETAPGVKTQRQGESNC